MFLHTGPEMLRTIFKYLSYLVLSVVLGSSSAVLLGRWIDPPYTALMLERKAEAALEGEWLSIEHQWQDWSVLSEHLKLAVIAGEDQHFPDHWGFDWEAIQAALIHNQEGGNLRGASTISQQVAKNLFLWSDRSWLRKAAEAWFTLLLELCWSKTRILEVYLNSVEWGDGIFGAESAAQHYFKTAAKNLTLEQASLLAAILPNPRVWSAAHPSAYINRKAAWIRQQMRQLGGSHYLEQKL